MMSSSETRRTFSRVSLSDLHHDQVTPCKHRYGFTGTLDGTQTHKWVLEGLFGPSYKVTQTKRLQDEGHLETLDIQCHCSETHPQTFDVFEDEVQFIIGHTKRSKFISNLALDLSGNTLVLFSRVESHGAILYEMINNKVEGRKKSFLHSWWS